MRIGSLFAGIGGICRAFKNNGHILTFANEIDKYACETYRVNSGDNCDYLVCDDINNVLKNIPDFDILTAGFPCQSFSIAGNQNGLNDERGQLFFRILDVIDLKNPEILFLENVKNLLTHDFGRTFNVITEELKNRNYYITHKVLNSTEYGNIPQNRERIYIIGFKSEEAFKNFTWPEKIQLTTKISDLININDKKNNKYYYSLNNIDIEVKNETSKKYADFANQINEFGAVYQIRRGMYVRKNSKLVCPTLTANMGTGGHNVPLIKDNFGVRKLTPEECFKFMGFDLIRPNISDARLYKQAGNSIVVPVIERIVGNI